MRSILAMVTLAVLSVAGPARADKMVVGMVPTTDFVPAIISHEDGFFAQQNVQSEIAIIPLISNIPAAIISGSVNIGSTTGPVFLQGVAAGLNLVAVAGASRFTPDSQTVSLVAGADSKITGPTDLKGKRVGVPGLNSLIDLVFRRYLILKGMQPGDVVSVETAFPQMADLLRNHTLDAALIIEPLRANALSSGAGTRISDFFADVDPNILAAFWIADRTWAEAHPNEIKAFRAGLAHGIDQYKNHPEGRAIELKVLKRNANVVPAFDPAITVGDLDFDIGLVTQFKLLDSKLDTKNLLLP